MKAAILRKARESADLMVSFFDANAEALERCVGDIAERFKRGGRLIAMGNGGSACDTQHVAVEFQHPIIEMPALCDYCFTVKSWSIHRIQETHTALLHLLWDLLHVAMGADDVI